MLKTIFLLLFLSISTYVNAQPEIVDKTFATKISWMCVETPYKSSCAGSQTYLVLQFKEKEVTVTTKEEDSCGEVLIAQHIGDFSWRWVTDKHWTILLEDIEKVKHNNIKNMALFVIDDELKGRKLNAEGKILKEYNFNVLTNKRRRKKL
ncbi:hypothetical protein ACWGOQ_0016425 [Aquimarina sp. M1]